MRSETLKLGPLDCLLTLPAGPETGPPMLLFHGLGGGIWGWDFFQRYFAKRGSRSYAVELPGHGDRRAPRNRARGRPLRGRRPQHGRPRGTEIGRIPRPARLRLPGQRPALAHVPPRLLAHVEAPAPPSLARGAVAAHRQYSSARFELAGRARQQPPAARCARRD